MPNIEIARGYAPLTLVIPMDDILYVSSHCKNSTLAVYIALYTRADFKHHPDDKTQCFPSYEDIRQRANVKSETTVSAALKELEAIGAIVKTTRPPNKKGERQTTVYTLQRIPQNLGEKDEPNSKKWSQPTPKNEDNQYPVDQYPVGEDKSSPDVVTEQSSVPPSSVSSNDEKKRLNKIAYGIFEAWCRRAGLDPNTVANRSTEMRHATSLAKAGYVREEVGALYQWCHDLSWRKSPVTLSLMVNQANAYQAHKAEQANKPVNKSNEYNPF